MLGQIVAVLMVIITSYSVESSVDWCQLIKPNGKYEGLVLYHRFYELTSIRSSDFVFLNKAGKEWRIETSSAVKNLSDWKSDTVKDVSDKDLVNRFGTYARYQESLGKPGGRTRDCSVIHMGEKSYKIVCKDHNNQVVHTVDNKLIGNFEYVVIKATPEYTYESDAGFFFFNKSERSEYYRFNPFDKGADQQKCNQTLDSTVCEVPPFIQQIHDYLFAKIEAVVDFKLKRGPNKLGYIILFNINGKPKYCITVENETLSDECKSPKNMKELLPDCFRQSITTDPGAGMETSVSTSASNVSPPKENVQDKKSTSSLIIGAIISSLVVIILVIIVLVIVLRRKSSQTEDQNKPPEKPLTGSAKNIPPKDGEKTSTKAMK